MNLCLFDKCGEVFEFFWIILNLFKSEYFIKIFEIIDEKIYRKDIGAGADISGCVASITWFYSMLLQKGCNIY